MAPSGRPGAARSRTVPSVGAAPGARVEAPWDSHVGPWRVRAGELHERRFAVCAKLFAPVTLQRVTRCYSTDLFLF